MAASADPFRDVTAASGINYRSEPEKRPFRILESVGSGCGFLDADGDGNLDVILVGRPQCAIYRNLGDGKFQDVTREAGLTAQGTWINCAAADYDRDGDLDLMLVGYERAALYRNDGKGAFTDVSKAAGIKSDGWNSTAAFADLDRDGHVDLWVGRYIKFGPKHLQYCTLHENGAQTSCRPFDYDPELGRCYRNRGDATFEDVTKRWGLDKAQGKNLGVLVADFNNDRWPDLFLANDEVPSELFVNQGGKRFEDRAVSLGVAYCGDGTIPGGMGVDWGDYDRDGWLDLIVGTYESETKSLFRNLEGGSFEWATPASGMLGPTLDSVVWGSLLFDYNRDGALDVIWVNGHVMDNVAAIRATSRYLQPTQLFSGDGKGAFKPVTSATLAVPQSARGAACGDFDNDGDLDLLILEMEKGARLLRNESTGHWAAFSLTGTKSNRDAIGARVRVKAGGVVQTAELQITRSYAAICDPRVYFGLGAADRIDEVEITWPSGTKQILRSVPIDAVTRVTEGK